VELGADRSGGQGRRLICGPYRPVTISPAQGEYLEAVGRVVKNGRTLTICQLDVWGVDGDRRKHVATGMQTLICLHDTPDLPASR